MARPRRPKQAPLTPAGWGGVVFAGLLLVGGLVGLALAVGSGVALVTGLGDTAAEAALRERGVVGAEQQVQAFHDHSTAVDGSAGCVLVDEAVIRFDDGAVTARVPTEGAQVRIQERPLAVVVVHETGEVACPFGAGEGADTFAVVVRAAVERATPRRWRPVDPRVEHLFRGG